MVNCQTYTMKVMYRMAEYRKIVGKMDAGEERTKADNDGNHYWVALRFFFFIMFCFIFIKKINHKYFLTIQAKTITRKFEG